jgi:hypothetical protein
MRALIQLMCALIDLTHALVQLLCALIHFMYIYTL